MKYKNILFVVILLVCSALLSFGADKPNLKKQPAGSIQGRIVDTETKQPLAGANIVVAGTEYGSASDLDGKFSISYIPAGSYSVSFSYIGYNPIIQTDVIVRPDRITFLNVELQRNALVEAGVVVKGGYFESVKKQPTSTIEFSQEEIRRAAGSGGDINRIIMALPSVTVGNDIENTLVVRGGSPMENGFFVDNIPLPNINHYPTQGSSGGAISLINVDFIKDVQFYSGGFSAIYGDKLSSIMNISYREGNKSEFDGQIDFSMIGFGTALEGPLRTAGRFRLSLHARR